MDNFYDQPAATAPSGEVAYDVPCRRCGYNLRGLSAAGRCPECGTPVGISIQGDLLRFADPAWVAKLHQGIQYILVGIAVTFFGNLLGGFLFQAEPLVKAVLGMAGVAIGLWGAWLLTEPDPSGLNEDGSVTTRKVIRFALLVGLVSQVLNIAVVSDRMHPMASAGFAIAMIIAGIIGVIGEIARLRYIGQLAARIPNEKLTGRAIFLSWAYGITLAALTLFGGIILFFMLAMKQRPDPGIMQTFGCVAGIVGVAFLIFIVMYLFLLIRMARALREQAALATQNWASAGGA